LVGTIKECLGGATNLVARKCFIETTRECSVIVAKE
jgi:hypothetical protein